MARLERIAAILIDARRSRRGFAGFFEGVVDGHVRGWVIDRSRARARVVVRFGDGPDLTSSTIADSYRADVQNAGLSEDGYCGFSIPLGGAHNPTHVKISPRHRVESIGGKSAAIRTRFLRRGSLLYDVDRRGGWISGFALDLDDPLGRRRLELVGSDGEARQTTACRFDARAIVSPDHDGFHGFRMPFIKVGRLVDVATGVVVKTWSAKTWAG